MDWHQKIYDVVLQTWIIEGLEITKISDKFIKFIIKVNKKKNKKVD